MAFTFWLDHAGSRTHQCRSAFHQREIIGYRCRAKHFGKKIRPGFRGGCGGLGWGRTGGKDPLTSLLKISFDTITFIACLNHIPNRNEVLKEARRLLKPEGRVLITMIDPILGRIGHAIWWYSEDKKRGGMVQGEVGGMWSRDIQILLAESGFVMSEHHRFEYGLNLKYLCFIKEFYQEE